MFELKSLYKLLYLYQVTFAFVTHSNESSEIALMFTLVGETAKTERELC